MADGIWLWNGNYKEEEFVDGNAKVEDLMECLTYPLTKEKLKSNLSKLINYISDLEAQNDNASEEKDDLEKERDEMEEKLDTIMDTIRGNTRGY